MKKDGKWKTVETVYVPHRDYREARKILSGYIKKPRSWQLRNSNGKVLSKHKCFEDAAKDETYLIYIHHIPVELTKYRVNKSRTHEVNKESTPHYHFHSHKSINS
jgi:hypothetical protein